MKKQKTFKYLTQRGRDHWTAWKKNQNTKVPFGKLKEIEESRQLGEIRKTLCGQNQKSRKIEATNKNQREPLTTWGEKRQTTAESLGSTFDHLGKTKVSEPGERRFGISWREEHRGKRNEKEWRKIRDVVNYTVEIQVSSGNKSNQATCKVLCHIQN